MKAPDHTASNEIISEFLVSKNMTTNEALQNIIDLTDFDQLDDDSWKEFESSIKHIANQLGVIFDKDTEQWVTADEGHPV